MKQHKIKRLLAGCCAFAVLVGTMPFNDINSFYVSASTEQETTEQNESVQEFLVSATTTRFNLTGGNIDDAAFTVTDGICTLSDSSEPAVIPNPSAPLNSNLVFSGWVDSDNNPVTTFEENMTYYANWNYGSRSETNEYSNLMYHIYSSGSFFDLRGNSGSLKTTYGNNGYDLQYKYTSSSDGSHPGGSLSFNGINATYSIGSGIYVTPVLSFCSSDGNTSENEQENSFVKIDYIIQNRGSEDITELGIASTADIMIGNNDRAPIYGYSIDNTRVTEENKTQFSTVPNVEMHDNSGNILSVTLTDDGDCWWGYYGDRNTYAFTGHLGSSYSTGYDSGIAYSWQNISLSPGETTSRNAIFAAGDIHHFRSHSFNADGLCFGESGCGLGIDHINENTFFCQPPIVTSENHYEIRNYGQLAWIADNINNQIISNDISVDLMCDIHMPDDSRISWTPVDIYSGNFNGNGYEISGLKFVSDTDENGGIFGTLNNANVHDLGIVDSCFESENGNTGSLAGSALYETTIERVYSLADIKGSKTSGLVYNIDGSSLNNVFFAGSTDNNNKICSIPAGTFTNVFYVNDETIYENTGITNISAEDLNSGMLAYTLGEGWYQTLGEDTYPVLNGESVVYRYTENHSCDEQNPLPQIKYTNDSDKNNIVLLVEHEYNWNEVVTSATCTENEYWNKKCTNCEKVTDEKFERAEEGHLALGHEYDWGRIITHPTCTENAVWSKKCIRCDDELEEKFERSDGNNKATGHTYDWIERISPPTCTENAVWSKGCINCDVKLDGTFERSDGINKATGHTYDWDERISPPTCTENAVWSKSCVNCGLKHDETFRRSDAENKATGHSYDREGYCEVCGDFNPTAVVTTTTVTAPTTTRATTTTITEAPVTTTVQETTTVTSPATTTTTTTREPFAEVTTEYDPEIEKVIEKQENHKLNITGEMSVTPMTKEDIINAGIDLSAPDNYHYFNYSIEMEFHDEPIIFTKYEAVSSGGNVSTEHKQVVFTPAVDSEPVKVSPGQSVYVPEMEATVGYYEYEKQEMFIIVYGESKWLKEFYDVQLIVFNSDNETLEDCSATLNVPMGLTLCNSSQTQFVGDLVSGGVKDIHWYLRGDEAGDYSLSALFTGKNDGDEFSYEFHSRNNLHVYAGNALKMTIEAPGYSCYGETYTMKIALTNVSDKPIYNLENRIKNVEHGYYLYKTINDHGNVTHTTSKVNLSGGGTASVAVDELLPGQSAVLELSINDLWKSPLQKDLEASKLFIDALKLGLGKMPIASFCASLASSTLGGITVVHILDSFVVTTLEGSTTEIPYEVIITDYTDEFIDDHAFSFGGALADAAFGAEGVPDGVKQFYYAGKYYVQRLDFYYDLGQDMIEDAEKVNNGTMTYEVFCKKYSADYLKLVTGTPINVSALNDALTAVGKDSVKIKGVKIPVTDIITVGEDVYKIFKKPKDEVSALVYITDSNGNIISAQAQQQSAFSLHSPLLKEMAVLASQEPSYQINVVDGNYEYNNGIFTLNDDALIEIKALKPDEDVIVHVVYSDGKEVEYPLISVPQHECKGGNYYVAGAPDSQNYGTAVQYCETCGKFMSSKLIAKVCTAMLSNGEIFQNVYDAVNFAKESNENLEVSIFGDITIDKDLIIPENVKLIVTPYANIIFSNGASIIMDGEIDDYTNCLGDICKYITLVYWDGRTEIMKTLIGQPVELPDLSGICDFNGWYSDPEFTESFEPFVAGEGEHPVIYYADIRHQFSNTGKCKECGELKNGRDAFTRASISVGKVVTLKFIAQITRKASNDNEAFVSFEFADGTKKAQLLKDAINNGNGTYTFECKIPANKMTDVIKAQICYSDNVKGSYIEYSIKQYTDYILTHRESFDESVVSSIEALVNFGGYAQIYSDHNTDNLVNAELNKPLDNTQVVISDEYKTVRTVNSDIISIKSASLSLSELIKINIKFALDDNADINDYKFTVDGKTVIPVKSGDYYIVTADGISPDNYDKMYLFKAESKLDSTDYASIKYSCFTYVRSILKGNYDIKLTNMMKALSFYNKEIENYIQTMEEN
ncbi:MAG: hypothetical protein IKK88_06095 [Oscillospiraceae bacterium]|nr:hypothetical protein [Oscillospiraceae bacterium]